MKDTWVLLAFIFLYFKLFSSAEPSSYLNLNPVLTTGVLCRFGKSCMFLNSWIYSDGAALSQRVWPGWCPPLLQLQIEKKRAEHGDWQLRCLMDLSGGDWWLITGEVLYMLNPREARTHKSPAALIYLLIAFNMMPIAFDASAERYYNQPGEFPLLCIYGCHC